MTWASWRRGPTRTRTCRRCWWSLLVAVDADATPGLVTNTAVVQANNDLDPTYDVRHDDNHGGRCVECGEDGVDASAGER